MVLPAFGSQGISYLFGGYDIHLMILIALLGEKFENEFFKSYFTADAADSYGMYISLRKETLLM